MKRLVFKTAISLLVFALITSSSLCASNLASASTGRATAGISKESVLIDTAFSEAELDELLAPIALYPDPLLAQVLPAATFIEQIGEAQKTLNGKSDDNLIAKQNWDISVKAVAHYPSVLQMMNQKQDWTTALGQAYVNQSTDIEKAIQRLRAQAKEAGNLVSSDKMLVETKTESGQTVIVVEPAQAEVIYVPQYNPEVVYVQSPGPSAGEVMLAFGAGLAMGAWLNRGWHWYGGGPYYHGWAGVGWIGRSSHYVNVNVNRNVYVNRSYTNINVNRNITTRNISSYRTNLQRDANVRVERTNSMKQSNSLNNRNGVKNSPNDAMRAKDTGNLNNKAGNNGAAGARSNSGAKASQSSLDVKSQGARASQTAGGGSGGAAGGAKGAAGAKGGGAKGGRR